MKKTILFSSISMLFSLTAFNQTININFEAVEKGTTNEVQMDSVYVENTNQDTSTTLYYPNFSLSLDGSVSSEPIGFVNNNYGVKSIYPNPFNEFTNIIINNPKSKQVRLSVYSLTGSLVSNYEGILTQGQHRFQVSTQYPGMYMVYLNDKNSLYKIISQPMGESSNSIRYIGTEADTYSMQDDNILLKSAIGSGVFDYTQGDTILVEGYADCYNNVMKYYVPQTSETYTLEFQYNDNIAPTLETNDITIYLGANGGVVINKADVIASASDNCTLSDTSLSISSFDCSHIGAQNVDVTLTDKAGNSTTLSAQVTVEDILSPELTTKAVTVELDENGMATIPVSDVVESASDNCSVEDTTLSQSDFDCEDIGVQTINVTIVDLSGNTTVETADVTVEDNIAPVLSTKAVTVALDASGSATVTAADVVATASDNCTLADTSLSLSVFDCEDLGVQTIDVTLTDVAGNETTLTAEVTVEDNTAPVLTTKAVTVALDASGSATITAADVVATASDNCTLADTTLSQSEFSCTDLGVQTINVTVTDASGNETTLTADITIEDNLAPSLITKAFTVELNGSGYASIEASDVIESANDNCSIANQSISKSEFSCDDLGVQTINVTVTDNSGNFTTKTAEVTVEEKVLPNLTTKSATFQLNSEGVVTINPKDVVLAASDNCSLADTILSKSEFTCSDIGTQVINVTLVDNGGNMKIGTANVTIQDKLAPLATPKDITIGLDAAGSATITADDVLSAYSDNCSLNPITLSKNSFDCDDIAASPIEVTITLTDGSGNNTIVKSDVTVEDNIAPSLTVKDKIEVVLDVNQQATIKPSDVVLGTSDNCSSTFDTIVSPSTITLTGNQEVQVDVTLTDESGNQTTKQVTVEVIDNIEDIQGNVYDVVQIGEQAWMAENMKATQYSNGDLIHLETDSLAWVGFGPDTIAYCYSMYDINNLNTYGVLYTWKAAMHGSASSTTVPSNVQGVCPTGWHIPSHDEWMILVDYIAGQEGITRDGDTWNGLAPYLKSTSLWSDEGDNTGNGTNDYGLNVLPGGDRNQHAVFFLLEEAAIFWSATETSYYHSRPVQVRYDNFYLLGDIDKKRGINVRCVKD